MKIVVKVKYGSQNPRFEDYGNHRYLAYLVSEDGKGWPELVFVVGKRFGLPAEKVQFNEKRGERRDS